jgi:CO/xanthine dehydrogenase Mo-binding subunit
MSSIQTMAFSRRRLLQAGGALLIGAAVPGVLGTTAAEAASSDAPFPPLDPTKLATWLAVRADNTVIARCGHVELGHGVGTGFTQIVAEELDMPVGSVSMLLGNTDETPDQGVTAGSTSIRVAGAQLRQIAAEGRAALLKLASDRFGVPAGSLKVNDGVVSDGSRKVSYGDLVKGKVLTAVAPITITTRRGSIATVKGSAKPKDPSDYKVVGKRIPRVDIPDKVRGKATYVQDVKVPGMLHARVIHPKNIGSTVISVGDLPPVLLGARVVRKGNLVAVLAPREWDAIQGARQLQVQWSDWHGLFPSTDLASGIRSLPSTDKVQTNRGDADAALGSAAQTLHSTYVTPYENHGMLGPSCAVADVRGDGTTTIWSSTQYPAGVQRDIAQTLGVPTDRVDVRRYEGPGCYGRLSANVDDAASEAAVLSREVKKPVRVQWMRDDEHVWEGHGPGTLHELSAGIDANGNIVGWKHEAWMPSNSDSTALGAALSGTPIHSPGIGAWTGPDLYTIPNSYEIAHGLPEPGASSSPYGFGLRTTYLRSPGQYQITYAQEAFFDEIAAKLGKDPLQLRIQHLDDKRAIAVLKAAAQAAGWTTRPTPRKGASPKGTTTGRGVAVVLRDGTYAASVVHVQVDASSGKVRVTDVTIAQDSGLIINPGAIEHQIESAVLQTVSRAMMEEVTFDTGNVTSRDWSTYPILAMADSPAVKAVLINHPEIASTGVGEPAVNVVAPAVASAIFDATGVHIRSLPLRPAAVKAAFQRGAGSA